MIPDKQPAIDSLPPRIAEKIRVPSGSRGYGQARWQGRGCRAHRLVYHLLVDPELPLWPGRGGGAPVLDHLCENRACCNPAHLILTTNRTNVSRKGGSSRYVGVCWHKQHGRWESAIVLPGSPRNRFLGRHDDEGTAAHVYDAAVMIVLPGTNDVEFGTAARHLLRHGVDIS
jgi:Zinc-binding loop region of homing endonuclease